MAQITILCDNQAISSDFKSEHGLSMHIMLDNGNSWLWDTGQSDIFYKNSSKLNVNLTTLTGLALSHGHYDHTGGLETLLSNGYTGPIYAHPDFDKVRYSFNKPGRPRSIGLKNSTPQQIKSLLHPIHDIGNLDQDLTMVTNIGRQPGCFQATQNFFFSADRHQKDDVRDDALLLLKSKAGYILILGCGHSGLKNTCDHIRIKLGIDKYHALLGGLHLAGAPRSAWEETLQTCREYKFERIYAGHCTGEQACQFLSSYLPDRIFSLGSGNSLYF